MNVSDQKMNIDSGFPTEVFELPSKGKFYASENPLSSGKIEMKYMTAKEEDILTSSNLIKSGQVLDKFMESLILSKVDYDSILVTDLNAILLAARVLAYGKDYEFDYYCPICNTIHHINLDITKFDDKVIDWTNIKVINNFIEYILPTSKAVILFKFLTHGEEKMIVKDALAYQKINPDVDRTNSLRLIYSIQSINGNADKMFIRDFVETKLSGKDSLALRKYIKENTPQIDTTFNFKCTNPNCELYNVDTRYAFPIDINFFWP